MTIRHTIVGSDLGDITLVADGDALTGLYFPGHWYKPDASAFGDHVEVTTDSVLADARGQLDEYFSGQRTGFELRTSTQAGEFQRKVWALLERIPYGETTTYGALASELGDPALAQAVGRAIGRNPLSVIVPCHRVVGKDGKLTGYAGGLKRKAALLELEEPADKRSERLW